MTLIHPDHPDEPIVYSFSLPSSFTNLPPPRLPQRKDHSQATELRSSLIRRFDLKPGTYSSLLDQDTYERVDLVYRSLVDSLVEDLSRLDLSDLCIGLYKRQEQLYGHINLQKHLSIGERLMVGNRQPSNHLDELWLRMSPFTEATRWLIEVGIKCCELSGDEVSESALDSLTAKALVILEWDNAWETIAHGVMPHELTIGSDLALTGKPSHRMLLAMKAYQEAKLPWDIEEDSQWLDVTLSEKTGESPGHFESPEDEELNGPMVEELGYSMTDWRHYFHGLITSFDYGQYFKAIGKDELGDYLLGQRGIDSECLDSILIDHSLSKETLEPYGLDDLRPAEHARRDSRLLRRPVVVLRSPGASTLCLYGIETLGAWTERFPSQLRSGRVHLPRMAEKGPLKRTVGKIQSRLGAVFMDNIADACSDAGLQNIREKSSIGGERFPEGHGFGPVDVFAVDRRHRRFVLAEVKDTDDPGFVSDEMRAERDKYRSLLLKVKRQVDWFEARTTELKLELGIDPGEEYAVEGVVVINRPRVWMYMEREPTPIVTDRDLFAKLGAGEKLLTRPVAI